jgi:hypothetical protein
MTLQSTAQQFMPELIVVDPSGEPIRDMSIVPLEVSEKDHSHHDTDHDTDHDSHDEPSLEVSEPGEISIVIDELPGAPSGTKDPEPVMEVSEEDTEKDDNDLKDVKKDSKWDWAAHGAEGFVAWIKDRCADVPKHSGSDTAGIERATAYLEKLDGEISKAMRLDLDGKLDADQVEKVRAMIDDGIGRLQDRADKIKKFKKTTRKKKSQEEVDGLVKEAQKITGVSGIVVTVDLLTSRIARVCINGMVSGGHSIEDIFARQVKEYDLDKREQACVAQLLDDMGFALRTDRGYLVGEEIDPASSDNMDFAANYRS